MKKQLLLFFVISSHFYIFTVRFSKSYLKLEDSLKNVKSFHFSGYDKDNMHNFLQIAMSLPRELTKICLHGEFERDELIYRFINKNVNTLKELYFYMTNINDNYLCLLLAEQRLNLKKIHLKCCFYVTNDAIFRLCDSQRGLEELVLEECNGINDISIFAITINLRNLKVFKTTMCNRVTNVSKLIYFFRIIYLHFSDYKSIFNLFN